MFDSKCSKCSKKGHVKNYARKSTIYILDNRLHKSILNNNTLRHHSISHLINAGSSSSSSSSSLSLATGGAICLLLDQGCTNPVQTGPGPTTSVRLGRSQRCWVCRFGPSPSLELIGPVQVLFESVGPIGLDRVDRSSLCSKRGGVISVFKMDNHTTSIIHTA